MRGDYNNSRNNRSQRRNGQGSNEDGSRTDSESFGMKKGNKGNKGMGDKKLIQKAMKKSHEEGDPKKLCKLVCKLFDKLEEGDIERVKQQFIMGLYEMANGKHFDEGTALQVVENMQNVDGTEGEHYSPEESKEMMEKYHFESKNGKYNEWDWYVILNMMHSDYSDVLGKSDELYVALTNAYFNGPDEKEGKAWTQMGSQLFEEDEEEEDSYEEDEEETSESEEEDENSEERGRSQKLKGPSQRR